MATTQTVIESETVWVPYSAGSNQKLVYQLLQSSSGALTVRVMSTTYGPDGTIVDTGTFYGPRYDQFGWLQQYSGNTGTSPIVGGGGGGSSTGLRQALEDEFIYWAGTERDHWEYMLNHAVRNQWTADDVRRWACDAQLSYALHGAGMLEALTVTRQTLARAGYTDPSDAEVIAYIRSGLYASGQLENYLATLSGYDWTRSVSAGQFMAYWLQNTGAPMTQTALDAVSQAVRNYGWEGAWDWFQGWVPTTESAIEGNYGASKRAFITDIFNRYLFRDPTEAELAAPGQAEAPAQISAQERGRRINEWARRFRMQDPHLSLADSLSMAEERVEQEIAQQMQSALPPDTSLWTLNEAAMLEIIRGTEEYAQIYAAMPDWMTEEQFLSAAQALNEAWRRLYGFSGSLTLEQLQDPELAGTVSMPSPILTYYLENRIGPDELIRQAELLEDVDYLRSVVNPQVSEVWGYELTEEQLNKLASGGVGSGALRALVFETENRLKFRETFRQYTGRDPEAVDYEYLDMHFISPEEYARTTAAYESAEGKLPEINDVVKRTLGVEYTIDQVQNMVLGRAGAGAMQAAINQAIKLDAFTEPFLRQYGRIPTPDEYAGFINYSSAAQLQREFQIKELVGENRAEIQELFREQLGYELSDAQLERMLGEGEGSGALRAQWKEAQKRAAEREQNQQQAWGGAHAQVQYASSPSGGIRLAVEPKPML